MRRLCGSAPSGIPVSDCGLSSLRRLRRSARGAFFHVCIYIWALYFVRRLRGSWPGVILASPRDYPWHLGGLFYMRSLRGSACGIFFYDCIYIWGFYFVRRLQGSVPGAFWLLPGDALQPLGVVVVFFFYTNCSDLCSQTLDRHTCPRTVAS